ncbi:MAG: hypothetical protein ABSB78_14375 [Bacteroidota bacterium]
MKNIISLICFLITSISCFGQERIFSLGYGKTFVNNDSSTLSLSLDLNRIPGQSEKAGGYYFINEVIGSEGWGYYLKPTMDINIGSNISSSPNNISVGAPLGLVYDFRECELGIFSFYIDGSPELVADKGFKNNLYYFSVNSYLKYEFLNDKVLLNILSGVSNANGARNQFDKGTDTYGRLTIPFFLKLICWNAVSCSGKSFKRINWTNSFKFNSVYADDSKINTDNNYIYFNSKFDFYFTPNIGFNITYFNGKEEPAFKRNNAVIFGLTLSR